MNTIFALRLKQARLMRGLSMDELCSRIGISKQSISKYENSKMMPDSTILLALSNILNVKIDYFFRPINVKVEQIEFRKKSKLGQKKISSIKEIIKDKIERYLEIEEINNETTSFKFEYKNKVSSKEDIYVISEKIKGDWKLGEDGINNLIEILEENQIKVIEIEAPLEFDGLSGYINNEYPIIVLNMNYINERKRFTALHELGHLILNFESHIEQKEKEKLCDLFANEMLISGDIFKKKIGANRKDISLQELYDIQIQFGISIDALMYKAKELNIITEGRYKGYYIKKNMYPKFKKDAEESRTKAESSNRFQRLVYKALASELISISKASVLLDLPIGDIRNNLNLI